MLKISDSLENWRVKERRKGRRWWRQRRRRRREGEGRKREKEKERTVGEKTMEHGGAWLSASYGGDKHGV